MQVQKSLAASPDVLKVDVYLSQPPQKEPTKVMQSENIEKVHQPTITQEASSLKTNEITECREANIIQDSSASKIPRSVPSQVSTTPENIANPWCFHQPQNQWLVPVMSPSEGLVYKPYSGPCPPTVGFMAPFFGNYAPFSFPPVPVDFMNPAYGGLPCHHQQPPICFPSQCGLPTTNPIISSSSIKQVSVVVVGMQPIVHDSQQSGSSCNASNPRSEVISGQHLRSQASKGSEVQGSQLTNPCENSRGGGKEALPVCLVSRDSNGTNQPSEPADCDNQSGVIRVVPHKARLAMESAARIFRSIQEERKQYDP